MASANGLDDHDSEKAVTVAMLRAELEDFVNCRLQQELANLKASILDQLCARDDDLHHSKKQRPLSEHLEIFESTHKRGTGRNFSYSALATEPSREPSRTASREPSRVTESPEYTPMHKTEEVHLDTYPSPDDLHGDNLSELSAALHETSELSDEKFRWHVAVATLEMDLKDKLRFGFELERGTVYGAAITLPQIARSAKWPRMLFGLCVRTYFFLLISYFVELMLLYLIWKEENVMDRFAGQMNLCDFGTHLSQCPGAPGCEGPLGSKYAPARLYDWATWSTRHFVQQSLLELFPDRVNDITKKVDAGEYGAESQECRLICCFVFVLSMMEDMFGIVRLFRLLHGVPSKDDTWIDYGTLANNDPDDNDNEASIDNLRIRVAGMPTRWKVVNVMLVLVPRTLICILTLKTGTHFLMESAVIADAISNALALSFIVSMPGLIESAMSTRATQKLMDKLETFRIDKLPQSCLEMLSENLLYQRKGDWHTVVNLLPIRLIFSIALTAMFILYYYVSYCNLDGTGRWVSKTMYLPAKVTYNFLEFLVNAFFPWLFPLESADYPYWQCSDNFECK